MQIINSQIRAFLEKEQPTDASLTDFINNLVPELKPIAKFHELDFNTVKEPTLVYAHFMVQDLRDSYYYYSFIMKRPFKAEEKYILARWGNTTEQFSEQILDDPNYIKVMTDRDPVICTPIVGLTEWARKLEGHSKTIEMLVDNRHDFKLGQIINVVAFYYPDHDKLYFVRRATEEEVETEKLSPLRELKKVEVDYEKKRQELLSFLCGYSSEAFAEYLLLSLVSADSIFLGADSDISPIIEAIYPRVKHLKLVHPCQQSLFPYKNQEGQLVTAPLQLSNEPTFVSVDLSAYSQQNMVQIGQKTIDNFKALKVFTEEKKTIYRWQYGESLIDHKHRGIIVKASSFITPDFHPKDQAITPDFSPLEKVSEETLISYREYLASVQQFEPALLQQQRIKIEQQLKSSSQKEKLTSKLSEIMLLSKLLARSYGRSDIIYSDFQRAKWLIEQQVPSKPQ